MPDFAEIRQTLAEATRRRDELTRQLANTAGALVAERQRLAALQASSEGGEIDAVAAGIRDLVAERAASARAIGELHERVRLQLDGLLGAALELEGDVPLVLLPVRIE